MSPRKTLRAFANVPAMRKESYSRRHTPTLYLYLERFFFAIQFAGGADACLSALACVADPEYH